MIRPLLLLVLAIVAALPAADLGPGPVPTNTTLLAPGPIGSTTPSTGAFTTLTASGATTFTAGTASTTSGTGTVVVTGGVGVSGTINSGNTVRATQFDVTANTNGINFGHDTASKFLAIGFGNGGTTNFGDVAIFNGKATETARFLGASGSLQLEQVGGGLTIKEGTNARMGTATMAAGTVTVTNTSVTASTRFYLTPHGATIAAVGVSAVVAATSFTIKSSSGTDTNTVDWMLVEPSP